MIHETILDKNKASSLAQMFSMRALDRAHYMSTHTESRQEQLELLVAHALRNPDIAEAMRAFQIGQLEYTRALASTVKVVFTSGNTTNQKDIADADLDTDKGRDP